MIIEEKGFIPEWILNTIYLPALYEEEDIEVAMVVRIYPEYADSKYPALRDKLELYKTMMRGFVNDTNEMHYKIVDGGYLRGCGWEIYGAAIVHSYLVIWVSTKRN